MKTEEFVTALKQKPSCINSEAMFADQMRVAFPNEPNERRLLVALYRVGIVSAIKNAPAIDDAFRLKFKKMIVATYGVTDEVAIAAVDLWCDGYGRGILQKGIVKEYSAAVARQPAPVSRNTGSGTASFSLCPFSIMLPTTTITAKAILIRFSVNFKSNANARLALDCGKITDSQRNVFQANPDNAYIPLKGGHAIICHNIWLGGPREEGTYKAYGLTPLLWEMHPENKLSIREYPLQFMLCLLDTIEPTKRFTGMRAYDILNKISIKEECEDSKGFDIVWNESLKTDDGNKGNSFKQWYKGIENMQEWMNITCKQEENSIKIRWD